MRGTLCCFWGKVKKILDHVGAGIVSWPMSSDWQFRLREGRSDINSPMRYLVYAVIAILLGYGLTLLFYMIGEVSSYSVQNDHVYGTSTAYKRIDKTFFSLSVQLIDQLLCSEILTIRFKIPRTVVLDILRSTSSFV